MVNSVLTNEIILFVTPLYLNGISQLMKYLIDQLHINFKDKMKNKRMYVLVVGGEDSKQKALPLIMQFKRIFDFFGATFNGYIIGEANQPNTIFKDKHALQQAKVINEEMVSKKFQKMNFSYKADSYLKENNYAYGWENHP
ncbi:NAD(P)H-dependent oxidoreductase [Bacillus salipaludis]|uniref:NAD(P)H-dependent oxidoreductase n=1 Tax=Bacillus salipaludis TaxID=2547811 RepID=A0AA90QX85_9BACI|nr:NAD(P)H-dependent oxidoreductase [Bacillus salipaludis]MDQ6597864.1 NAD(P)H-dependent oxidoreductase [Bacillus salipaludis]